MIWFHLIIMLAWPLHVNTIKMERAIDYQANVQMARYYPHSPIAFGSAGIPVYVVNEPTTGQDCGQGASGCHNTDTTGPYIVVWSGNNGNPLSVTVSHEVLETLADPNLTGTEICDPVENDIYMHNGVWLQDFILPDTINRPAITSANL